MISPEEFTRKSNMYPLSIRQWNPFVGCEHDCSYCRPSFQRPLKHWSKCKLCQAYKPHKHRNRLEQSLPKTRYMQFIFTNSSADSAFCEDNFFFEILDKIDDHKDKSFLIQSKDPKKAFLERDVGFPKNLILGTTIETHNAKLTRAISKAPDPLKRYLAMSELREAFPKQSLMVTMEPVLDFDSKLIIEWIERIAPCMIWIGYDSKNCKLVEPRLADTWTLAQTLIKKGYVVILKFMRKAWWEDSLK